MRTMFCIGARMCVQRTRPGSVGKPNVLRLSLGPQPHSKTELNKGSAWTVDVIDGKTIL